MLSHRLQIRSSPSRQFIPAASLNQKLVILVIVLINFTIMANIIDIITDIVYTELA